MKLTKLIALPVLSLAFAASAFAGAPAKAPISPVVAPEEEPLGFSLTAGYDSSYIFRGVKYGDHLVSGGLSVPIKLADKVTFTFAPWYGNIADSADYDDLDLVASLAFDLGFATVSAGYTWFYYPFSGFQTHEPNITIAKSFGPVNWFAGAYLDVNADGGDLFADKGGDLGWYFETGVNSTIKISDKVSLVPEVKVSYGADYYGVDGFNNVVAKLGMPIALTSTATLTPYIAGSIAVDGLEDLGVDDYLFGGIALTVTF